MAFYTCIENFCGAILKALAASNPMRHPRDDSRTLISADIQDEIGLKTQLRTQWKITRASALKAEINFL